MKKIIFLILISFVAYPQTHPELNTILMNATFKIVGDGSVGTVFILGKPSEKDTTKAFYVLVTANHVLNGIKSDSAIIFLRKVFQNKYI